jgi:RimJ/RimL family protein N-acetyltransferase
MSVAESLLPLVAGNIVLRRLSASDLVAFQGYRRDPVVGLYQGWSPQPDEEAERFLVKMADVPLLGAGAWTQLGITERGSSLLIGDIGVFVDAGGEFAEIGFSMSGAYQGRGLATEAVGVVVGFVFRYVGVRRVIAVTDDRNASCIRLLERIGMTRRSTDTAQFRGEPCLEHTYEVLAAVGDVLID